MKVFSDPTNETTCGDMIFSGHTMTIVLCAMVWRQYCREYEFSRLRVYGRTFERLSELNCRRLRKLIYALTFVGTLIILGTRLHYTLDVSIAVFLTMWSWLHYHNLARCEQLKRRAGLMMWLEAEEIFEVDACLAAYDKSD